MYPEQQEVQILDPRQGTLLYHLFPLTATKLRFACSVCGEYWSQGMPEQIVDLHISGPRKERHLDRIDKVRFGQCLNCTALYGQLRHMCHRPYEHDAGFFEKTGNQQVVLLGTGPTDD